MADHLQVLIVDDSHNDAELIVRELQQEGFEPNYLRVETLETMKTALEQKTWDVVISNFFMAKFTGLEALKVLQEKELDLPFIIVSDIMSEDIALQAMKAGVHAFFKKKNIKLLVPAIERALREVTIKRERKQAEEKLRAGEERFRQIFENMSNCVAIYEAIANGEDFIIKNVNRAAERVESVTRKKILGRSVLEVFPGVKEFGIFEVFQRVWKTGKPEFHPTNLYKDNRISGWRENFVYKLPSGELVAI